MNIRATFAAAQRANVISSCARSSLERIAKDLFYPDRAYPIVLGRAAEAGLPAGELDTLGRWLPTGRVNLKRRDALAMLRVMRDRLERGLEPKRVGYVFEPTLYWEIAIGAVDSRDTP